MIIVMKLENLKNGEIGKYLKTTTSASMAKLILKQNTLTAKLPDIVHLNQISR